MKWTAHAVPIGDKQNVGKAEGKRRLGSPRCRWERRELNSSTSGKIQVAESSKDGNKPSASIKYW